MVIGTFFCCLVFFVYNSIANKYSIGAVPMRIFVMGVIDTKDRRKLRRCRPETDAFVVLKSQHSPFVFRLLDISTKGLAFSFLPHLKGLISSSQLDIMLPHPVCHIKNIPFKHVSDCEISIQFANGFATKRCGVEFNKLNQGQKDGLECLIKTLLALPWGFSFADRNIGFQRPYERECPIVMPIA